MKHILKLLLFIAKRPHKGKIPTNQGNRDIRLDEVTNDVKIG